MRKLIRKWLGVDAEIANLKSAIITLKNRIDELRAFDDEINNDVKELKSKKYISPSNRFDEMERKCENDITELSHKLADLRLVVQELQATEDAGLNTPKVKVVKVKGKNAYQLKYITEKPTHYVIGTNKGYATIKSISKGIERKVKIWTPKKEA